MSSNPIARYLKNDSPGLLYCPESQLDLSDLGEVRPVTSIVADAAELSGFPQAYDWDGLERLCVRWDPRWAPALSGANLRTIEISRGEQATLSALNRRFGGEELAGAIFLDRYNAQPKDVWFAPTMEVQRVQFSDANVLDFTSAGAFGRIHHLEIQNSRAVRGLSHLTRCGRVDRISIFDTVVSDPEEFWNIDSDLIMLEMRNRGRSKWFYEAWSSRPADWRHRIRFDGFMANELYPEWTDLDIWSEVFDYLPGVGPVEGLFDGIFEGTDLIPLEEEIELAPRRGSMNRESNAGGVTADLKNRNLQDEEVAGAGAGGSGVLAPPPSVDSLRGVAGVEAVSEAEFWEVVEGSRRVAGGDLEAQVEALQGALGKFAPERIAGFEQVFVSLHHRLYDWGLWGVAYLLLGGCSDDGFVDVRSWVIGQGRDLYERCLADPRALASGGLEDPEDIGDAELLAYAAGEAYEEVTGRELEEDYPDLGGVFDVDEPTGEPWTDEDDLQARFPDIEPLD